MKIDLGGEWTFRKIPDGESMTGQVPGSVYADLLRLNQIEDPYYRENELEVKKISEHDFQYSRYFNIEKEVLKSDRVLLVCKGLDTIADVFVNESLLAKTDNMHRKHDFDVKKLLKAGENKIRILFRSPLKHIQTKQEQRYLWNVGPAETGLAHIRKAHYMFGWDWGPTLPDMGIWRDIYVEAKSIGCLIDVHAKQIHHRDLVTLEIKVKSQQLRKEKIEIHAKVIDRKGNSIESDIIRTSETEFLRLDIKDPMLWWPNGYGDQNLYQVEVLLICDNQILDKESFSIGLRTLTVSQEEDEWGNEFAFKVNGIKVFAMGANYIPEDNILSRCNPQRTERLISDCIAANFNTIRVWGGGIYPEDYFYDLCDKYGLIIWQDFLFACAVYEMTDEFKVNISKEVEYNSKRLRHHPSLGLWCGNNEMEWAWMEWDYMPKEEKLKSDYLLQFEKIIPEALKKQDKVTFYWPASPSSGGQFASPNNENKGDVHDWEVWHGRKPFTHFRAHFYRFLSEFGMQSFPSLKTIKTFTEPKDRNIFSKVMEHHQKNDSGNETILFYIAQNFKYPKDLAALSYASQLLQAEAMKYAVEHMRRHRGRCMGSIYWQLNDCWPVASWSSIDSLGRWKALHYFAKRFYNPVLLSACDIDTKVSLHLTNDTLEPVSGKVAWKLRDNSSQFIRQGEIKTTVEPLTAREIVSLDFFELDNAPSLKNRTYLEFSFFSNNLETCRDSILFVRPKHFEFLNPKIETDIIESEEFISIQLLSRTFAKYVELDFKDFDIVFDDNYFHLTAGEPVKIEVKKTGFRKPIDLSSIRKNLIIRSVFDIDDLHEQ